MPSPAEAAYIASQYGKTPDPATQVAESENIPELVVEAPRIPWWAWALAGVMGYALLETLLRKKS